MKILTTIIFVALAHLLAAQPNETENNRFSLKINPLPLLDIYGGISWRIGTEFKLKNNIAASLEYGKYFNYGTKGLKLNTKGDIIRVEVKYYRNDDKLCLGGFFSLEYLYKNTSFDYIDSIKIASTPTYEKRYTIYKEISCLTFKVGELNVYKNHFLVEWYMGVGLRFYTCGHNTLTDEENDGVLRGEGHGDLSGDAMRVNAFKIFPNLSAGVKLGFKFK